MSDCDRTMFCETSRLLHKMYLKELVDHLTYQRLNQELYIDQNQFEGIFAHRFRKYLYVLCENVPFKFQMLPYHQYIEYIEDNEKKIEEIEPRALNVYKCYLKRKEESIEKNRLQREERERKEAEMNERLRPRIMRDLMTQSDRAIIFPDIK